MHEKQGGAAVQFTQAGLSALVQTCIGRRDDYALQRADGSYYRAGRPLTVEALRLHLTGCRLLAAM